jgi:TonB family protein
MEMKWLAGALLIALAASSVSPAQEVRISSKAYKLARQSETYRAQSDWPHQLEVLGTLIELWTQATGPNSPTVAHYLLAAAEAYERNGDFSNASTTERRAIAIFDALYGPTNEASKDALKTCARLQAKLGKSGNEPVSPSTMLPAQTYRIGAEVSSPKLISKVDPIYPEPVRHARLEGRVTLAMIVDSGGRATSIAAVDPLGLGLDEAAVAAVKQWTFEPGQKDGKPVAVLCRAEVTFRLK